MNPADDETIAIRRVPSWKRPLDVLGGIAGTVGGAPFVFLAALAVWLGDRHNPFYISPRIGLGGRPFRFIKIRTMVPNASASGVDTTIKGDARIVPAGALIRRLKLDELPQFWHVLSGEMSLVGPRPNVRRETELYTAAERELLSVRPGITDYSSIVFSDLAEVLAGSSDANIAYNQLVRPWKSRLGLHYVQTMTPGTDVRLVLYTFTSSLARPWTLQRLVAQLKRSGAPTPLCEVCLRDRPLTPSAPPGAEHIVTQRR